MSTDDRWADYLESGAEPAGLDPADLDPADLDPADLDAADLDPAERARLDATRRVLAEPDTWDGPPAGLEARLLDLAAVTPQDGGLDPAGASWSTRSTTRRPVGRTGRFRTLTVAAAAAAAAVVFAVVVPQIASAPATEHYAMAGTTLAPRASAKVDVESKSAGDAITLHITGLTAAPAGSYYAGWLTGPVGTVPVGTFHWRKGGIPIELWSGVDTAAYPDFVITLQREGPDPNRSDQVVLRGTLRP